MSEPLIAYRIWHINGDSKLYPLTRYEPWEYGNIVETDEIPTIESSCRQRGIHAWKNMGDLIEYLNPNRYPVIHIIGRVALWGKIVEHQFGYRAQFAYPHSLDMILPQKPPLINYKRIENSLRDNYKCEVGDLEFTGEKIYEDGTIIRLKNGLLHSDNDFPTLEFNGKKEWWKNGYLNKTKLHEKSDSMCYFDNTKLIRADYDSHTIWFNDKKQYHREDGPAIEWKNGRKEWFYKGRLHRGDGPAVEQPNGKNEWYYLGMRFPEPNIKLIPTWAKEAVEKELIKEIVNMTGKVRNEEIENKLKGTILRVLAKFDSRRPLGVLID